MSGIEERARKELERLQVIVESMRKSKCSERALITMESKLERMYWVVYGEDYFIEVGEDEVQDCS